MQSVAIGTDQNSGLCIGLSEQGKVISIECESSRAQKVQEEADEMTDLKEKLDNMTQCLMEFREKYEKMSALERCVVSWKNERRI